MKTVSLVIFEFEQRDVRIEIKKRKICIFNDKLNSWIKLRDFRRNTSTFFGITVVVILIPAKPVRDSPQALLWAESKTSLLTIFEEPGCEKIICTFPHCYSWKDLFHVSYGKFHALSFWAVLKLIVLTCPDSSAEIILVRMNNTCIARGSFIGTK